MRRNRTEEAAAARAQWLAELADALLQAQNLAWQLGQAEESSSAHMDLYGRIETLRGEVRSLQLRPGEGGIDPEWTIKSPWCPPAPDNGGQTP